MTNINPKISVIIPVYNAEKYLEQCLDSIVLQTYENLEIILVNDGSTDSSAKIMQKYAANDARIKIIKQENKGLSTTRNVGMEHASGDYISFIDADDYVALGLYDKFIKVLQNQTRPIDIFLFNGLLAYEYEMSTAQGLCALYDPKDWTVKSISPFKTFAEHKSPAVNTYATWNKIYRKSWLDEHNFRFPDGYIFEDRYFSSQTYLETENIYIYEDFVYFYRQHGSSLTQTMGENIFDIYIMADEMKKIYQEHNFYEPAKYSYFEYILHEMALGIPRCRPDLLERYVKEGKKRINEVLPDLDKAVLPQLDYYGIYQDVEQLSLEQLREKYKSNLMF